MRIFLIFLLRGFFFYLFFNTIQATENRTQLYFIGLQNDQWSVFTRAIDEDAAVFKNVTTLSEPREVYYQARTKTLVYLDAAAQLRHFSLSNGKDRLILHAEGKDSYAQPVMGYASDKIYLVKMPFGKSNQADIVAWQDGQVRPVVRQLASQFEPFLYQDKWLYFGHVHCTVDCGRIIQEIWRKNLVSGESEQLTMLGHVARQPVVDQQGQWLYFSSNRSGHYHIWRQSLSDAHYEQLTDGSVIDTDPALDDVGHLYFIRRQADGNQLMWLDLSSGTLVQLPLPEDVKEIRNLRINH